MSISRRTFLSTSAAASAAAFAPGLLLAQSGPPRFEPKVAGWRRFEVTTSITLNKAKGATQVWLPVPSLDNDYQRGWETTWTGNAASAEIAAEPSSGARMVHARFDGSAVPTLAITSRVETRNRSVDWSKPISQKEDEAVLKANLVATNLQPIDGVVRETALAATKTAQSDVEKVRALYEWMVVNTYRDPSTPGCGTGDIKAMLTSGKMGGKCADLNALFVAMARSVGIPARDVYGLRIASSAFGYRELGGNPASLKGAQHCRAEVWLSDYGWVAMDPADVLKVMRLETTEWIKDAAHPLVAPVHKALFGSWECNWVGWNTAHDLRLPGAETASLPFLMYPQGQDENGRFDELAADNFAYAITARELNI